MSGECGVAVTVTEKPADAAACGGRISFSGGGHRVDLHYPGIARLEIRDGRTVSVTPSPGADPAAVRALVLGPALAVLLHQRGVLALHASSVLLSGVGVVAFLGGSGWGKSTMAASLHRRGHDLVADDITAVDAGNEEVAALPAFPRLKLWPEAAAAVGIDPATLPSVSAVDEKKARRVAAALPSEKLPLAALYVLAEGTPPRTEPLTPGDALLELIRHSFCAPRLADLGSREHFLHCAEIARRVPMRRLTRPRDLARLDEIAAIVEKEAVRGS